MFVEGEDKYTGLSKWGITDIGAVEGCSGTGSGPVGSQSTPDSGLTTGGREGLGRTGRRGELRGGGDMLRVRPSGVLETVVAKMNKKKQRKYN